MSLFQTRQAVIVANQRSGGTFLATCLSNHPDIHCERGEVTHRRHIWRTFIQLDNVTALQLALHQHFYRVSMCRLTYGHAFLEPTGPYLLKIQPYVLWLRRENWLRQAVSNLVLKLAWRETRLQRAHTMAPLPVFRFKIEPRALIHGMDVIAAREAEAEVAIKGFKRVLELTYTEITGGKTDAAGLAEPAGRRVCAFLGVDYTPMPGCLRRVNPAPLDQIIINWPEMRKALEQSAYARFLEPGL